MSQRFFSPHPLLARSHAELTGPEAHHLLHVMRAEVGDRVILFDGEGAEYPARITSLGRSSVQLDIEGRDELDREAPGETILAVALPRGDRQEWLVQKAVELGVHRLVPWITQRSVADPKKSSLERLERTVIEASKQCGRNRLMVIDRPLGFHDALTSLQASVKWMAHPSGEACLTSPRATLGADSSILLGIGPEGGFTDQEIADAQAANWRMISLGARILRTETAALTMAAWRLGGLFD